MATEMLNFRKKKIKNLLLRSHKGEEAETSHKCLCYYALHKLCFLLLLRTWFSSLWQLKVDLYDLVIFDNFWPSDWRGNRNEL